MLFTLRRAQLAFGDQPLLDGAQLTLRLKAHANVEQLQRMLTNDRLQASGMGAGGVLQYRYLTGP